MRVSLICTVLNEGESIRKLMDSVCAQTRLPDEVVIVDGGSRDNTVAVLREYEGRVPLRVLVEPGANISRGRNIAIAAATGDVIASVDAGVRLEPAWLERLIDGFVGAEHREGRAAVAGFFVADGQTTFEIAMGATVLPTVAEIKPDTFLPSSRSVAFTRPAWEAAGGYPEWIDYCEDLIFDFRLTEVTGRFGWVPDAVVHFRPRGSFRSFFKQYYRYARGDGKADLWRKRHAIRYATYLIAFPALLALSIWHHTMWLLVLIAGVAAYCRTPYRRLARCLPAMRPRERLHAIALVPLIRAVGDVAKMLGYPAGWAWRLMNWQRPEIHWRN
jgi:glycosyltransferase involved in cell wall biosynthesis